jgi:hypothetical protein
VLFLPTARMLNSHLGKSNKSMVGGMNGVIMGALGLKSSTKSKPKIWFSASHAFTGAAVGRSQSKNVTSTVLQPCSPNVHSRLVYVHALSETVPMGGFRVKYKSPSFPYR